jgi:hypothetical protein
LVPARTSVPAPALTRVPALPPSEIAAFCVAVWPDETSTVTLPDISTLWL